MQRPRRSLKNGKINNLFILPFYGNKQLRGYGERHTLSKRQSARQFFLSPIGDGTAILRGVPSQAKVQLQGKGSIFIAHLFYEPKYLPGLIVIGCTRSNQVLRIRVKRVLVFQIELDFTSGGF